MHAHTHTHTHTLQWHVKSMTHDGMTGAERLREHKMACNRPSSTALVDTMTAHSHTATKDRCEKKYVRRKKNVRNTPCKSCAWYPVASLQKVSKTTKSHKKDKIYIPILERQGRELLPATVFLTQVWLAQQSSLNTTVVRNDFGNLTLLCVLFLVFFMLPVDENHQTLCAVLTSISDRSLVGLHKADKTIRGPPNFKLTSTFLFKHGYHP